MNSPLPANKTDPALTKCFARSVLDALSEEPTLEAVTINRARRTISVATLGKSDEQRLSERLSSGIQNVPTAAPDPSCALLSGQGDCADCELPLSAAEREKITIQHEGDKT